MGLDMYLKASKYVGGWNHTKKEEPAIYNLYEQLVTTTGITPHKDAPSFTIEATIGYWRKANAIHAWFVKNVQDEKDECQDSDVSREQLTALRDACNQVLTVETVPGKVAEYTTYYPDGRIENHARDGEVVAQRGLAASVLPTQSGFFFGKTEYDEDYLADIRDTVAIIDKALALPDDWYFTYRASW